MNVEQMPNPRRVAAGRLNGLIAKGRKTAEGRARSAQNAIKHNLSAQHFQVLPTEDQQKYAEFAATWIESLAPQDPVEHIIVTEIITNHWKLARIETLEMTAYSIEIERILTQGTSVPNLPQVTDNDILTWLAYEALNENPAFQALARYRAQCERSISRSNRDLAAYRAMPKLAPVPELPEPDKDPKSDAPPATNSPKPQTDKTKVTDPNLLL